MSTPPPFPSGPNPPSYGQPGYQPPPGYQAPPGYQPPPGYQQYGMQPMVGQRTNGLAVASLVLGILSLPLCWLLGIPALLAIIFGAVGLKQINQQPAASGGRGLAIAGLVLGIVSLVIFVLLIALGNNGFRFNRNN